jgi:ATPase subunit of ABC transporter with duplicated ATPase domains
MIASAEAKMLTQKENAKKQTQITDLKNFVSRFSANASKAKQASSRQKQLDKIQLVEIKPSSRRNPHIVFEEKKRLHKEAVTIKGLSKGFENLPLFKDVNMTIDSGERVAIIGANGIGKSTFINCLLNEIESDAGTVKWAQNAQISYFKQDNNIHFVEETTLFEWMLQHKQKEDDEQTIRNVLGRLLFSQDEIKKSVKVLSGGEKSRLLFGKFMLQKSNVLVMDEATNHLDMESIESLNQALIHYSGTLLFISHDREFISSIATRIIEITADEVINFGGNYSEYLDYKKRRQLK